MVNIKIYAKTELDKKDILDWMIKQLLKKGEISLMDLLEQYMDRVTIMDSDCFSYHEVGWNVVDLDKIFLCRNNDHNDLRISYPKIRFRAHYT